MIDAHAHLWLKQAGKVDGKPVYDLGGGKSMFGDEVVQMMPPYMTDGVNSAERFLANMDFARVGAAVITQEYIDGSQDGYLREVRRKWPERFRVTCLYEENGVPETEGTDGIKICGGRLTDIDLTKHAEVFRTADERGMFIAIDMADGDTQVGSLREMIQQYPDLRIAIGHAGRLGGANQTGPVSAGVCRKRRNHLAVQRRVLSLSVRGEGDSPGEGPVRDGKTDVGIGLPPDHDGDHVPDEPGFR